MPRQQGQGTSAHHNSTQTLAIPLLGPQPVATHIQPLQPAFQHHHYQPYQQQHNRQQQNQGHHNSSLSTTTQVKQFK